MFPGCLLSNPPCPCTPGVRGPAHRRPVEGGVRVPAGKGESHGGLRGVTMTHACIGLLPCPECGPAGSRRGCAYTTSCLPCSSHFAACTDPRSSPGTLTSILSGRTGVGGGPAPTRTTFIHTPAHTRTHTLLTWPPGQGGVPAPPADGPASTRTTLAHPHPHPHPLDPRPRSKRCTCTTC